MYPSMHLFSFYGTPQEHMGSWNRLRPGEQLPDRLYCFLASHRHGHEQFLPFDIRKSDTSELGGEQLPKEYRIIGRDRHDGSEDCPVQRAVPGITVEEWNHVVPYGALQGPGAQ